MDKPDSSNELNLPFIEAFLVGLAAGLSAVVLKIGVDWIGKLRIELALTHPAHIVLPAFGLIGGFFAGMLVDKVAPETAGSGIPQVKAALNRVRMALDLRVALAKLLGGTLVLGSGLFMGREGPTVQLGAALAASLSRRTKNAVRYRRQLIAAGAGAGLAAAFNAPIAGVVFVLEELLKDVKSSTVIITLSACGGAAIVLNLTSHYSHLPTQEMSVVPALRLIDLPFVALLGVVCAFMGCIFNASIIGALNFYQQMKRVPICLRVSLAGLCTGLIVSGLPPDFYNYASMRAMIVSGQTSWTTVVVAFLEFFLLTLTAYGSGAPGGLFAPCLVLGATLGYLVGLLEVFLTGHGSPTTLALVGMGAFFAGVGRVPLTAITITFELTASFALVTPLMIACSIASFLGEKILPESIYDKLMVWNGINLRRQAAEGSAETEARKSFSLRAVDVMKYSTDQTLSSKTTIAETLELFRASTLRGLPVVDKGRLVGVLTQQDLSTLIHMEDVPPNMVVKDLMTSHPVSVNPYDSLEEILFLFTSYKFTWLPVCDGEDRFIGIISQSDVASALFSSSVNNSEPDTQQSAKKDTEQAAKSEVMEKENSESPAKKEPTPCHEEDISALPRPNVRFEIPKSELPLENAAPVQAGGDDTMIKGANSESSNLLE